MSDTKVDMPKVCQMFDAGWQVLIYKDGMGSYTVEAVHHDERRMTGARQRIAEIIKRENPEWADDYELVEMFSDTESADFTPEQALTRLAYKLLGEIL